MMKKIFLYLLIIVPLLCSCQSKYNAPPYNEYEDKIRKLPADTDEIVIPKDWQKMDSLSFLRFKNTERIIINGDSIPNWIVKFKKLQSIYSEFGKMTSIQPNINELNQLKYITFFSHQIVQIPNSICELKKIEFLSFWSNEIDNLPNCLFSLKKLKTLNLMDNNITEISPDIAGLENLEKLYLDGNQISELPENVYNLKSLKEISLGGNPLKTPGEIKEKFEKRGVVVKLD